jgi:butyrate kinase
MIMKSIKKFFAHALQMRASGAPVYIYPGEDEMHALAFNGLMVLKGEVEVKEYV